MANTLDPPKTNVRLPRSSVNSVHLCGRRPLKTASQLIQSTHRARKLAFWVSVTLVFAICAMLWLPWQQTAQGGGRVIAFSPLQRAQEIKAPTKGIILDVPTHIREGVRVKKGDLLLTIQPTASNMAEQLDFSENDLEQKLQSTERLVEVYQANIQQYEDARDFAVMAADEAVEAAEAKLRGKQEEVVGYEAKELQARRNYDRQLDLYKQGIKPLKEIEKLEQELESAKADLKAVREAVKSATSELENKKAERDQKRSEAQTKVESARGIWQKTLADAASIRKEMRDLKIKQSTLLRNDVCAPNDGVVHRLPVVVGGQTVKEGDYLLTLVPDTTDLAIEMTVVGNDLPLVRVGNHVRLQFEGWPSLQFTGWPAVAVGTFGGEVAVVDPTDDGSGMFRVLVRPDPHDRPWPDERYLRQGLRANGWIMLGTVTLGYEIWRRINGFPPSVDYATGTKDGSISSGKSKSKPPLPK